MKKSFSGVDYSMSTDIFPSFWMTRHAAEITEASSGRRLGPSSPSSTLVDTRSYNYPTLVKRACIAAVTIITQRLDVTSLLVQYGKKKDCCEMVVQRNTVGTGSCSH